MANMALNKTPMPEQDPMVRNKNFEEVALGYTPTQAMEESKRCVNCKEPACVKGCPVGVHIPEFLMKVADGKFEEAYEIVTSTNSLPAVCGRVCPQENQCEGKCVRGIKGESVAIGRLERFVADYHMKQNKDKITETKSVLNGKKVAVIGSGPAGLACAGDLADKGYDVTVFEAFHKAGGVLVYGIPEFRLPKRIVAEEIKALEEKGVKIATNMVVGRSIYIDELFKEGFKAVFIGSGAGLPQFLGIPGETLLGVYSANEYLTRINLMKAYLPDYDTPVLRAKSVAVIGGGNVAMDAARCAKRMGAEDVYIIYRRSMAELPAREEEISHAIEEEIGFKLLTNPVAIMGDEEGYVKGVICSKMKLGEPDESGRRKPVEIKDSHFFVEAQAVILAIGTSPNPLIKSTTEGLKTNEKGCILTDENMATSKPGVYAGGDAVTGAATVILAMGAGKKAAQSIDDYIIKQKYSNI